MRKMASCDSQGSVYICETLVYRPIVPTNANSVKEVHKILGEGIDGVIETEICNTDDLPPELNRDTLTLMHRRIPYISYPNEWSATMLQDAALFHLDLAERLLEKGLYLKDFHPWNILFDSGRLIFIDFTSMVTHEGLFAEEYLESNRRYRDAPASKRLAVLTDEIFKRMYRPYFSKPLIYYAAGKRERVRQRIEETTINVSTATITLRECFPSSRNTLQFFKKLCILISTARKERLAFSRLLRTSDVKQFYTDIRDNIKNLPVAVNPSAYTAYYQQKGENQGFEYSNDWNAKQKSVHDALKTPEIRSVVDVASNTGWYALMAEKLGKIVVAFDLDEACIETLYRQVRKLRLNVLPLVMDFNQLTKDWYSLYDGNKVLINATERLKSDSVLALGIIHHLVLGLGLGFAHILDHLVALCRKQMVIEYVDPKDEMILNNMEFFPAYHKKKEILSGYDMNSLISLIEGHGFEVNVRSSHPETRKILVCNRHVNLIKI